MSEDQVKAWLAECAHESMRLGPLIRLYEVDGDKYLEIIDFRQQIRSKSKFAGPDINLISDCAQNDRTRRRRSRSSETEAQAEADGNPGVPPEPPTTAPSWAGGERFPEFIALWPRVANPSHACRIWLSVVESVADEDGAFAARDRYLASDEVARGVITDPAKWLQVQKRCGWAGRWPPAAARAPNGKSSTAERVLSRMQLRIANGEEPL